MIVLISLSTIGYLGWKQYRREQALALLTAHLQSQPAREIPIAMGAQIYLPTEQTWRIPKYDLLLSAGHWLIIEENCILGARLNALKWAGMIPPHWSMADFVQKFPRADLYDRWGFNWWTVPLNDSILDEVNQTLHPNAGTKYVWNSVQTMDELVYAAAHNQHIAVHINTWYGPNKNKPYIHPKDSERGFNHAVTIIGIRDYDPVQDIVEFEVYDPFPMSWITQTPVYSKINPKGFNIFSRQGLPYIGLSVGAPGYITAVTGPQLSEPAGQVSL